MIKTSPKNARHRTLQDLLMQKKKQLLADVKKSMGQNLQEDVRLAFEAAQDNPDRSVEELLKHIKATITGNKSKEVDKIDAALIKLKEGSYGICEECGGDIPLKRLTIVPFAVYCVTCQQELEKVTAEGSWEPQGAMPTKHNEYTSEEE